MSQWIRDLKPIQAQTPSRTLGGDRERRIAQQRTWLLRRRTDERDQLEERRRGERRLKERRLGERRTHERRSEDRRQEDRPGGDRRVCDRRQGDRRLADRRLADRRLADRRPSSVEVGSRSLRQSDTVLPLGRTQRRGLIDDYA